MLEKKWVSLIRLSKKVEELESKVEGYEQELKILQGCAIGAKKKEREKGLITLPLKPHKTISGHRNQITCVRFHPLLHTLASSDADGTVKFWDGADGRLEQSLIVSPDPINCIAFDKLGFHMVTGANDMNIKVFSLEGEINGIKTLIGHEHAVLSVEWFYIREKT